MADEVAPVPEVTVDQTVTNPPVAEESTTAAPVDTPVVGEINAHAEPTLLQQAKAPGAEEVVETPVTEEPKVEAKAEEKPAEKTVEAPKVEEPKPEVKAEPVVLEPMNYTEKYKVPETLKMDEKVQGEFHSALDQFRTDGNLQPLMDLHAQAMERHNEFLSREQHRVFNDTRKTWRDAVLADPEIGGAGHQTAMQAIARVRDNFVSNHPRNSPEYMSDLAAFDGFLQATGAGDHPMFLKFVHNVAHFWDEPGLPSVEAKPLPNNGAKKTGSAVMYDHPTSTRRQ